MVIGDRTNERRSALTRRANLQGRCAGKKAMSLSYELNGAAPAKSRDDHDDKSTREKWKRKSAINLGLALIVIPLISLALWWVFLSVVWPVFLVLSE
jgi:hypothetical protein